MTATNSHSVKNPLLILPLLACLVLLYLFFPTLRYIAEVCWSDDDYSHGILLPLVSAYMIWDRWDQIIASVRQSQEKIPSDPSGEFKILLPSCILFFGLLLFFFGTASGIFFANWIAFFPAMLGLIFLSFGKTLTLISASPLLILFMAKPLPDSLVVRIFWPLQVFAARVSAKTLELLDVPVYLTGNIIEIPGMKLLVEEACSGMRSVMALVTLALIVIYFIELRWFSKLAIVALSLLVAVMLNIFRVALTGLLAYFYDPAAATGFFHSFSGLIVFLVGLPILYYAGLGLLRLEGRQHSDEASK